MSKRFDTDRWWLGFVWACLMVWILVVVALAVEVLFFPTDTDRDPCVPGYAIDYRGDLGAWLDRDGKVVLLAPEEDTYGWCV